MKPGEPPIIGGYRVAPGGNGVWFLENDDGRTVSTFYEDRGGLWRGVNPRGALIEHAISEDVTEPHLMMARILISKAPAGNDHNVDIQ